MEVVILILQHHSDIFLTDDTSPEESFARAVKGNIIGWADKSRSHAGSSTVKGTINLE